MGRGPVQAQVSWIFRCTGCGADWLVKHTLDDDESPAGALQPASKHCDDCGTLIEGEFHEYRTR